ncbi:MAG TPA: ATP-dependent RecD-like DNA helicase [Firmicutes bacterium]|nr:ATP-dependent RecD-like DNA helicase [Bacillota bacterium]
MDRLEGVLEKIRFYSEESAYLVGSLRCRDGKAVTIVGNFPPMQEGENLLLNGHWQVHNRYGKQLEVDRWERILPATEEGLKRYLSSRLIKGIGPVTAARIVDCFGLDTLEIMEKEPHRLQEVEGIGAVKAAGIVKSYRQYKDVQNVLVFLQGYGVGVGQAMRLYRRYGSETVERVQENPYRMAEDIFGIGFKTADKIARQLGMPEDSPERLQAAITYSLSRAAEEGHVFLPREILLERVRELLDISGEVLDENIFDQQLLKMAGEKRIHTEHREEGTAVYYAPFFQAEQNTARLVMQLSRQVKQTSPIEAAQVLGQVKYDCSHLTEEQLQVLEKALHNGVLIVTGGPGTGKTTTIKALLAMFRLLKEKVVLAAPTGRAAKRVTEATGQEAFTIHRLLEYSYSEGEGFRFQRNEKNPVEAGIVIIDEASMVDLLLMYNLLKAIPSGSRLILVGDVDQLPAVGAGNVLRDLISAGSIPCFRLGHIFRQARESLIIVNAHRINQGQMPYLNVKNRDFFFLQEEDPEKAARLVVQLCRERLPNYGPFDPLLDLQVITPMRKTAAGVDRLNMLLQEALNPSARHKTETSGKGTVYRLGDKVMQIRNNYQKEVYNGDIGIITAIDREEGELVVTFRELLQPRPVVYDFTELDELVLSYAVSVHKSQGSEYPVIIMPVLTQHYMLLQRNLLYTGITRARKLAVLVGSKKALAIAVHNNRAEERYSYLDGRLLSGGSR